jgi:hypothetical protein
MPESDGYAFLLAETLGFGDCLFNRGMNEDEVTFELFSVLTWALEKSRTIEKVTVIELESSVLKAEDYVTLLPKYGNLYAIHMREMPDLDKLLAAMRRLPGCRELVVKPKDCDYYTRALRILLSKPNQVIAYLSDGLLCTDWLSELVRLIADCSLTEEVTELRLDNKDYIDDTVLADSLHSFASLEHLRLGAVQEIQLEWTKTVLRTLPNFKTLSLYDRQAKDQDRVTTVAL